MNDVMQEDHWCALSNRFKVYFERLNCSSRAWRADEQTQSKLNICVPLPRALGGLLIRTEKNIRQERRNFFRMPQSLMYHQRVHPLFTKGLLTRIVLITCRLCTKTCTHPAYSCIIPNMSFPVSQRIPAPEAIQTR